MRIAILNWSGGENDPFSYFSGNLQRRLRELGHDAIILALDDGFATALHTAHEASPVQLAFAWQGIGSEVRRTGDTATLWERLGIPVVCHHGDHPCYNPPNHVQSSPNLIHLYACASFAKAANLLIRGPFPGLVDPIPNFLDPVPPPQCSGTPVSCSPRTSTTRIASGRGGGRAMMPRGTPCSRPARTRSRRRSAAAAPSTTMRSSSRRSPPPSGPSSRRGRRTPTSQVACS